MMSYTILVMQIDRKEAFRRGPRLNDEQSSSLNAYKNIRHYGFSRGHISPVGETFILNVHTVSPSMCIKHAWYL